MPNWCECDLRVEGPGERDREFLVFARGEGPFDFGRFLPYPEEYAAADRDAKAWDKNHRDAKSRKGRPGDGYHGGGYAWCVKHWGTKWNTGRASIREVSHWDEGATALVHFRTAWSPPKPVIVAASKRFPDLAFVLRYFESGVGFNGHFACRGGTVTADRTGEYFGNRGG
jgi:hypothetical protein